MDLCRVKITTAFNYITAAAVVPIITYAKNFSTLNLPYAISRPRTVAMFVFIKWSNYFIQSLWSVHMSWSPPHLISHAYIKCFITYWHQPVITENVRTAAKLLLYILQQYSTYESYISLQVLPKKADVKYRSRLASSRVAGVSSNGMTFIQKRLTSSNVAA